ncbi:MAG: hypothetical protein QW179_05400 [Candidatus Hadarchaeales archaeon]
MVLVAKVFEVKEKVDFTTVVRKLKDFREEQPLESGEKLLSEIQEIKMEKDAIQGVFTKDFVLSRYYRGEPVETLVTEEVPFWLKRFKDRTFLIVLAPSKARGVKKLLTAYVANKLSEILFIKVGAIVETEITHETLKRLHESNPQATKLIWFDSVDIPGVAKIALAGTGLADTGLYKEHLKHGKIWYAVFEIKKRGLVVGITRNCVITLFSRSEVSDFVMYVMEEVLPLIS